MTVCVSTVGGNHHIRQGRAFLQLVGTYSVQSPLLVCSVLTSDALLQYHAYCLNCPAATLDDHFRFGMWYAFRASFLQSTLAQPQMLIVSDVEDIFLPIQNGVAVDPVASKYEL